MTPVCMFVVVIVATTTVLAMMGRQSLRSVFYRFWWTDERIARSAIAECSVYCRQNLSIYLRLDESGVRYTYRMLNDKIGQYVQRRVAECNPEHEQYERSIKILEIIIHMQSPVVITSPSAMY